jgi:hypothetical protein
MIKMESQNVNQRRQLLCAEYAMKKKLKRGRLVTPGRHAMSGLSAQHDMSEKMDSQNVNQRRQLCAGICHEKKTHHAKGNVLFMLSKKRMGKEKDRLQKLRERGISQGIWTLCELPCEALSVS